MSRSERVPYFVTCAPGLEPLLHEELRALNLSKVERQVGGCAFTGTRHDARAANLWLRTAIRVLARVARFEARNADELYQGAAAIEWERWIPAKGRLVVDAQARDSELRHTRFVEQRVKDAIVDRFRDQTGDRPSIDKDDFDLRVHVHVYANRVTMSIDTSGHSLHRRGWRKFQGRAPLAETSAAALVLFSGWNRRAPLIDPFCGSATILIEAARIAGNQAPSLEREFGFERWLDHDAQAFAKQKEQARQAEKLPKKLALYGYDRDPDRVREARENVVAAGLEQVITIEQAPVRDFAPKRGWNAWVVTNPPYGERVGDEERLKPLYSDFGDRLRSHCEGYHLALLSGNPNLARELRLRKPERIALKNGGIDCELLCVEIAKTSE